MSWRDVAAPEEALRFSGAAGFLSLEVCDAADLIFEAGSDGSRANGESQADGASGAATSKSAGKKRKKAAAASESQADGASGGVIEGASEKVPKSKAAKKNAAKKKAAEKKKKKQKKQHGTEQAGGGAAAAPATEAGAGGAAGGKANDATHAAIAAAPSEADDQANATMTAEESAWAPFGLSDQLVDALLAQGFVAPTQIQAGSLPPALLGRRDIVGAAETGSGKTLAFGLPILNRFLQLAAEDPEFAALGRNGSTTSRRLFALVVTPTRELALQVSDHLRALVKPPRLQIVSLVGGMSIDKQRRQLQARPQVIVATPGRLWELTSSGVGYLQDLKGLHFFVLDEVDRMVEAGHYKELGHVIELLQQPEAPEDDTQEEELPPPIQRQTFLFSATLMLPQMARELNAKRLKQHKPLREGSTMDTLMKAITFLNPIKVVDFSRKELVATKLEQAKLSCLPAEKDAQLFLLLQQRKGRAIIFCNAISAVSRLRSLLTLLEVNVLTLQGGMQQRARLKALERFRNTPHCALLATDVAARGLDVEGVDYVVHYQLPRSAEVYVHRSGRTARAAAAGLAVALIEPADLKSYRRLCHELKEASGLPDLKLPLQQLPRVKEIVSLARQIDKTSHVQQRAKEKETWHKQMVKDMDLPSSDEELGDDEGMSGRNRRAEQQKLAKLGQQKKELAQMLRRWREDPEAPRNSKRF